MKKSVAITLAVVIVGAGSWVGATWYTGKRIEESTQQRLAEANEKLAKLTPLFGLRIDQIKYERGLFSTQARYGLSFVKNDKTPDDMPAGMIEFDTRIEHGPFPKSALARGAIAPKLAFVHAELAKTDNVKPVFELTKDVSPLVSDAVVSFGGHTASTARIAPVKVVHDGNSVDFSGMEITGTFEDVYKRQVEELRTKFALTSDPAEQKKIADELQRIGIDEGLYVPLGQMSVPTVYTTKLLSLIHI